MDDFNEAAIGIECTLLIFCRSDYFLNWSNYTFSFKSLGFI